MTRYLAAFTLGSICGLYVWAYIVERIFPDPFPASTRRDRIQWSRTPAT